MTPEITIKTMANGITIMLVDMPWSNSTVTGTWVKAGARAETKQENGIAHFLEHMAFKGTTTRNSQEIAQTIEERGGMINAYTGTDTTAYYAKVLNQDANVSLELIADIMNNSTYLQEEIDVERGVILQEIKMYQDQPTSVLFNMNNALAYGDTPMGREILGPSENIQRFKQSDFLNFVNSHYGPDQLIVGVAGAINNVDEMFSQIESLYSHMKPTETVKNVSSKFIGGINKVVTDINQSHVILSFNSRANTDPDVYKAKIAMGSIDGGMSGRLFQEIREKRGLCYSIHSGVESESDVGMSYVYAGTEPDKVDQLTQLIIETIKQGADNITSAEVEQAKTIAKAGLLMSSDSIMGVLQLAIKQYMTHNKIIDLATLSNQIDNVSVDDVKLELNLMCDSKFAYSVYGPMVGETDEDIITKLIKG